MKKLFALLAIAGVLTIGFANTAIAQDENMETTAETTITTDSAEVVVEEVIEEPVVEATLPVAAPIEKSKSFHQVLKEKFIEGDAGFMGIVLLCLVLGLALVIERIIYLNLSTTNSRKLLDSIESSIQAGNMEEAKETCRNTRGPVASIFVQGLERYDEGIDNVEKSIVSYGGVMMGRLEQGLSWISLFISLAPMLGFMGTVIGMIQAFDTIQAVGDISPTVVAGGIKVALLTTVFGLIVAIILQIFYNYCLAKIDSIVNDMEDASISFIDILTENKK